MASSHQSSPLSLTLHMVFWSIVFLLNTGPDWHSYLSAREVIEVAGTVTVLQMLVAMTVIFYLVPAFLDKGRIKWFTVLMLLLLIVASQLNILISYFYLEPSYPDSYGKSYQSIGHLNLIERLGFSPVIKYILFSKLPLYFFPAAVLTAANYYRRQQAHLELREQKQAAELDALKSQLNPHFIFNTLNNIYALALKKSDQTAESIAKLSRILDYVLYRCSGNYVSLKDEVNLLEDYVALEKLRFGDRLIVSLNNQVQGDARIAPILLLTLVENAFKHGSSQELNQAKIDLALSSTDEAIEFVVSNTKPARSHQLSSTTEPIGLNNLRRQLDLLYPNTHTLEIIDTDDHYTARLILCKIEE